MTRVHVTGASGSSRKSRSSESSIRDFTASSVLDASLAFGDDIATRSNLSATTVSASAINVS